MRAIDSPWIQAESRRFANLGEFFALSEASDREHEFTVAWVDCAATGTNLGRGILLSGDFALASAGQGQRPKAHGLLNVSFTPPMSLINRFSLQAFNALYYRKPEGPFLTHYEPFFYPLDAIGHWNRIYGPRGFLQYQCVLPPNVAEPALRDILGRIGRSGQGSFLAVLKRFGERPSLGMLSFPRPGVTIALDFPMLGRKTLRLLDELDAVVAKAGGALYSAKDGRMGAGIFRRSFPTLGQFLIFVEDGFESGFWQRMFANELSALAK